MYGVIYLGIEPWTVDRGIVGNNSKASGNPPRIRTVHLSIVSMTP
jgi:hypothetical protein